jgi:hypothetical protein
MYATLHFLWGKVLRIPVEKIKRVVKKIVLKECLYGSYIYRSLPIQEPHKILYKSYTRAYTGAIPESIQELYKSLTGAIYDPILELYRSLYRSYTRAYTGAIPESTQELYRSLNWSYTGAYTRAIKEPMQELV